MIAAWCYVLALLVAIGPLGGAADSKIFRFLLLKSRFQCFRMPKAGVEHRSDITRPVGKPGTIACMLPAKHPMRLPCRLHDADGGSCRCGGAFQAA